MELIAFEDRLVAHERLEDVPADLTCSRRSGSVTPTRSWRIVYLGAISTESILAVRKHRKSLGIEPVYKLVDTCAAEFEAVTPYFYSTYERSFRMEGRRRRDSNHLRR